MTDHSPPVAPWHADDTPPRTDDDVPPGAEADNNGRFHSEEPMPDPEQFRVDRLWPAFADELRQRADGGCPAIPTGISGLDDLLGGGLPLAQVSLLCGSPGAGKTSLALQVAINHARNHGPAVFWSLELPTLVALARMVCQESGAPWAKVLTGQCLPDVEATGRALAELPLYLTEHRDSAAIEALLPQGGRPALLVLDYAQLLASVGGRDQRVAVEEASEWLKEVAKLSGAAVMAISSTSRAAYSIGRDGKVSLDDVLTMARDTGRLEFDSAVVIGLVAVREKGEEETPERYQKGWLAVAKNRLGQKGKVPVEIDGLAGTVREISPDEVAPSGGGTMTDEALADEILKVVELTAVKGEPLTSVRQIKARVRCQGKRVGDMVKRLLHPEDGRLKGGGGEAFRAVGGDS